MKALKIVGIVIGCVLVLYVISCFFLPSTYFFSRSTTINAPSAVVFNNINNFKHWLKWSPWHSTDSNMLVKLSQPSSGKWAFFAWDSKKKELSKGKMTFTECIHPKKITLALEFEGGSKATESFLLDESPKGTKVTFTMKGDMPFLFRPLNFMMEMMIAPEFETALSSLKKYSERTIKNFSETAIVEIESYPIAFIDDSTDMNPANIAQAFSKDYGEIMAFLSSNKTNCVSYPIAITRDFSPTEYHFSAGMPIPKSAKNLSPSGRVKIGQTSSGKAIIAFNYGAYSQITPAYNKILEYMKLNNLKPNGNSWEEYISNPANTPQEQLLTIIYFPIK